MIRVKSQPFPSFIFPFSSFHSRSQVQYHLSRMKKCSKSFSMVEDITAAFYRARRSVLKLNFINSFKANPASKL